MKPFLIIHLIGALLFAIALSSCAGLTGAITGQPIPSTPVAREGGPPVNVATSDLIGAEAGPPETVYGLYDAGRVAAVVRDTVKPSK